MVNRNATEIELEIINKDISDEVKNLNVLEREKETEMLLTLREKKGKAAAIFKIKDKIIGNKK